METTTTSPVFARLSPSYDGISCDEPDVDPLPKIQNRTGPFFAVCNAQGPDVDPQTIFILISPIAMKNKSQIRPAPPFHESVGPAPPATIAHRASYSCPVLGFLAGSKRFASPIWNSLACIDMIQNKPAHLV